MAISEIFNKIDARNTKHELATRPCDSVELHNNDYIYNDFPLKLYVVLIEKQYYVLFTNLLIPYNNYKVKSL